MRLPWVEVNARPGFEAAQLLEEYGLRRARERYKWACPVAPCTSSDAFHTYRHEGRRSRCFVCNTFLTNVDLAALVRREEPRDACRWLAEQMNIPVEAWAGPPVRPRPTPPSPSACQASLDHASGAFDLLPPPEAADVYDDLIGRTTLTHRGAAYLKSRGFPPAFARAYGMRSVDGPSGWAAIRRHLRDSHSPEALEAAGFGRDERGRPWTPFGGLLPMLIIPYRHAGRTLFVRMRTIGPPPGRLRDVVPDWNAKRNRYRAPRGVVPPLPFNADALGQRVIHLVEGELNALTLLLPSYDLNAIGLPGAGALDPAWAALLGDAEQVVTWFDEDDAGRYARRTADHAFSAAHGRKWVEERLVHIHLPSGTDANRLHVDGSLAARFGPTINQARSARSSGCTA